MLDEKIELVIAGKNFANWFDIDVTLSLDSFDSIQFSAPFEPNRPEFRKLFRPFSYQPVQVLLNGDQLFDGTMLTPDPETNRDSKTVKVSCYAFPGVLCDCTTPTGTGYRGKRPKGAIKTQFEKLSLQAIAQQLCDPFDLDCEFRGDVGPKFDRVAIGFEEKIHTFLVKLARQRGFVITNTEAGKVLFWKTAQRGVPVVDFEEGVPPLTKVKANFNPQDYYSHIYGYAPGARGKKGGVSVALNPFLGKGLEADTSPINEYRPLSCKFDDTERADAPNSAKAKLGRMFGNMVSWTIDDLPTWRDPQGKLWDPNTSLTMLAPGAMIYKQSEFLVREVKLSQATDKLSASLNVVLAGSFSGEVPSTLPWDE